MTKWKKELTKKLTAQLAPMYQKVLGGSNAFVDIPAEGNYATQRLYFAYQSDVVYDDMYGGSHVLEKGGYVSCYYVEDGGIIVEFGTNLVHAIDYMIHNFSTAQLSQLQIAM